MVLATLWLMQNQQKTGEFGIFLIENDELVISDKEIIAYNKSSHEITLTQDGINKVENLNLKVPMDGLGFVIKIEREPIYQGWFWSPISSLPCSGVVIQTFVTDKTIQIQVGYPNSDFQDNDPRSNPIIFDYFESIGKLVY